MDDTFEPFADEEVSLSRAGVTFENRRDRVVIYDGQGMNLEITRDRQGLERARALSANLAAILPSEDASDARRLRAMSDVLTSCIAALEAAADLPATAPVAPVTIVGDPFAP